MLVEVGRLGDGLGRPAQHDELAFGHAAEHVGGGLAEVLGLEDDVLVVLLAQPIGGARCDGGADDEQRGLHPRDGLLDDVVSQCRRRPSASGRR